MLEDTNADYFEKAIIAGHYVFATDEFADLKARASARIVNLDEYLKNIVKASIFRYMKAFNLT